MLLVLWRIETRVSAIESANRVLEELSRQYPRSVGTLFIIERNATPPSAMAREALARMLAGGNDIACSAVAFEGSGFRAAFVRGVVTGLTILARHPFPNRIFAGVPEASSWLRSQMPRATSSFTTDFELIEGISNWRLDYARQLKVGSAA